VELYGIPETVALIERALSGALVAPAQAATLEPA